ncbi:CbtA family protein [Natronomonas pharaonis DSM 2160]|uniref:CbtA family protein n=1 Tax=Natronomonas pharaonis (strain ATCC 35678 / DSM 2160 / CIP 103997 / JCM 8858 / NBRC 14720 / NCIMB 2260 / Gabara) TaxID=348780 RepID=A0A1U7EUI3_NATPD|nr:CbtA family protein [Natronomonas pharaonis]CAI48640.1 CbtA family protein [Natronomonas pharaonis DSM 2160]
MISDYLQRGVAAGLTAGLAYALYMVTVGNPLTDYIHDAGHSHDDGGHGHDDGGHGHEHAAEAHEHAGHAVSETTTAIVSAGSGVLWGIFLGGVFAVALYVFEPALPGVGDVKAYVLAGAGFFSASVMPWLVLPPAAPGAENIYGIETRLAIYLGLVVAGAVVSALAIAVYNRASRRHVGLGVLAGAVPVVAAVVAIPVLSPTVVSHPGLDAELVSTYQALAALSQAALWLLIAGVFCRLEGRFGGEPARQRDDAVAT